VRVLTLVWLGWTIGFVMGSWWRGRSWHAIPIRRVIYPPVTVQRRHALTHEPIGSETMLLGAHLPAVTDALESIVFANDKQVYDERWQRVGIDVDAPRAEVTVRML